ncbi:hypothetical protein BDV96DRAFT_595941 [Lophiotrema nucula]|uniref:Rhodopsin domain-containing protein n=1 Tax=Lophiotrema nucula TaxID=690887 RepID=A0A6A5ZNF7_9PLEO|nr:hypothetical protein BDV96DRAFT_595941 [Lophiotrema nucula]
MFFDAPSVPATLGSIICFLSLAILAVGLRFQARHELRQGIQIDDWLALCGLLGVIGITSMLFAGVRITSLGYPWIESEDPTYLKLIMAIKFEVSSLIIFAATNGFIKLSVLFFYRRIFVVDKALSSARNLLFCTMIILIAMWSVVYTFTFTFMCGTRFDVLVGESEDDPAIYCVDTLKVGYSYAISDFISDAIIILIPIPFILKLHLPPLRKAGVIGVFMLGVLASAASLVRLAWMVWNQKVGFQDSLDNELMITTELYWMNLEITLGLLACCLPSLRGLLKSSSVSRVIYFYRFELALSFYAASI